MDTKMTWIKQGTPEWDEAWAGLAIGLKALGLPTGFDAGEGWQYMGTSKKGDHQFRNRNLDVPGHGDCRVYAYTKPGLPTAIKWTPNPKEGA